MVYRGVVRDEPQFVEYFPSATPEQELHALPSASRPAKRRQPGAALNPAGNRHRIFAWTSNAVLMLPAWFGAGRRCR